MQKTFSFFYWLEKGNNSANPDERIRCYTEAIKCWNESDEKNRLADAYYERGRCHRNKGLYDEARKDFNNAILLDPKYSTAYYNCLFFTHCSREEYITAISQFHKVTGLDSEYGYAVNSYDRGLTYIGILYGNQKLYKKSLEYYDDIINRYPKSYCEYNNRGIVFSEMKQYVRAIQDFNQALKLEPKYECAYNNRGFVYFKKNDYPEKCGKEPFFTTSSSEHPQGLFAN